jgi:hypothetical protein
LSARSVARELTASPEPWTGGKIALPGKKTSAGTYDLPQIWRNFVYI